MHTYERSVRVAAPFEAVWEFHSTEKGLEALTPDWMGLEIESVTGPDGEPDPAVLDTGATIEAAVRPFGVGPRQRWQSEIVARERSEDEGFFRDTMHDGPFPEWEHTHSFTADGAETIVRDHVEYELPLGPLDGIFGKAAVVGFEPMFLYRHRQTRALLES